jgi:nucleotidyltransferase/DNA polymerase involved in DNA repair
MAMTDPRDHLDRRYENAQIAELPDAPIDALRGLGKAGSETLRKAIGVKTIRDLADNRFVLAAQEIVRLAEGPTALALHHEAVSRVESAEGGASAGTQEFGVEDVGGGR